jgi:hypothetical protein
MTGSATKQSSPRVEPDCFAGARNDQAFSRRVRTRVLLHEKRKLRTRSRRMAPAVGPAPSRSRPAHKKIRKAERRQTRMSNLRARNLHPSPRAVEDRGGGAARVQRDALACRRSTAALAAANQRRRSAPARASWDAAHIRRYLKRACPSPASFSQTGHGAGRAFSRSRPGTAVTSRRPREPHSPQPPASPGGRPVC